MHKNFITCLCISIEHLLASVLLTAMWKCSIYKVLALTILQWNSTKKPEKWKKHSVSIFVHFYPRKNVSTSDLSSSQITSVGKRNLGNISRPRRCLGLEKFFLGSFFLLRQKLGKTQIRRGQIFPGIKLDKYRNKILFFNHLTQQAEGILDTINPTI